MNNRGNGNGSGNGLASLRSRLLALAAVALVPLVALIAWNGWQVRQTALAEAHGELALSARLLARDIVGHIQAGHHLLHALAQHPDLRAGRELQCGEVLRAQKAHSAHYGTFVVLDRDGRPLCHSASGKVPASFADREYFRRALATRLPVTGEPVLSRVTGRAALPLALPLLDATGNVERVLAVGLDLEWLNSSRGLERGVSGAVLTVWRADATILYRHPDNAAWVGKRFPDLDLSRALRGDGSVEARGPDGVLRVYAFEALDEFPEAGIHVSLGVAREHLTAAADRVFAHSMAALALIVLAVTALSWLLAERYVRRPVAWLDRAQQRLASGELGVRVPPSDIGGELGRLLEGFNRTAAALERATRARRVLSDCNRALVRSQSEPELLEAVCRIAVRSGGYRLAWVGYAQHDAEKTVRVMAIEGADPAFLAGLKVSWGDDERGRGPSGTAIRTGRACVVRNLAADPALAPWRGLASDRGMASALSVPLRPNGAVEAALSIFAAEADGFDDEERELLAQLAEDLSFGIRTLRLRAEHARAEQEIRALNAGLERRVEERTAELARANAELARANELKSEFLATMSHELRTPLNAIIGFSEVLKDGLAGRLTPEQSNFAHDIHASGRHLLSLINDILDLSKVEAGMMTLEREPVDLAELLHTSLGVVRERATKGRVTLDLQLEQGIPAFAADRRRLKQIVYNLVANAVKFTPAEGRVRVAARRLPRESMALPADRPCRMGPPPAALAAEFIEIEVADTGIGIAEGDLPRLFQPFVQVESALARRHEGTGLGLAMVLRLAGLHGGTAGVASRPGEGTSFFVWLPFVPAQDIAPAAYPVAAAAAAARAVPRGEPLALVVEDDDAAAALIERVLRAEGFRTRRAATAEEALVRAAKELPDLITLDVSLPHMDGWEFLARAKADAQLAAVPVVLVSVTDDLAHGLALGATRVLQKPFSRAELKVALAGLVRARPDAPGSVLIADDDPRAVDLLAGYLGDECRVLRTYGGREALEIAARERPDVILLDLVMPGLSGFDVIERLKTKAETAAIPVVVVSAKDLTPAERAVLERSAHGFAAKAGLGAADLVAEVRRAVQGQAA